MVVARVGRAFNWVPLDFEALLKTLGMSRRRFWTALIEDMDDLKKPRPSCTFAPGPPTMLSETCLDCSARDTAPTLLLPT
jgi:hypothetical protein